MTLEKELVSSTEGVIKTRKTLEKKEETKTATKPAAKTTKPAAKKNAKPESMKESAKKSSTKKDEVSAKISLQFSGKDYTTEDLINIAKNVWIYDCGKKEAELKTTELYIKPQESKVYYVFNGEITGDFVI